MHQYASIQARQSSAATV